LVSTSGQSIKHKTEKSTSRIKTTSRNFQAKKLKELTIASDILESTDDYVTAFDRTWNIIYINKTTSKYFGMKPEELIGKNFWKTFPKFVGTDVEKNYLEAMDKREIRRFEWKTIYANTGFREFTVFPSAEGIMVYGVDITERKQLQQKLEEHTKKILKSLLKRELNSFKRKNV
jgi:PAS domain S-box-containing protein